MNTTRKDTPEHEHAKYRELAEHARELLFQQQERFARVDEKAARHLSAITVLFGAMGFFAKWVIDEVAPPSSFLEWTILVLGLAGVLAVLLAWSFFFRVLRHHTIEFLRLDDSVLEFVCSNIRVDVNYYIAERSSEAFNSLVTKTHKKAGLLAKGYRMTIAALVFLAFLGGSYAIQTWDSISKIDPPPLKPSKGVIMPDDTKTEGNGRSESQKPDSDTPADLTPESGSSPERAEPARTSQPDLGVEGPTNIHLTEGYDPSRLERDSGGTDDSEKGKTEGK